MNTIIVLSTIFIVLLIWMPKRTLDIIGVLLLITTIPYCLIGRDRFFAGLIVMMYGYGIYTL